MPQYSDPIPDVILKGDPIAVWISKSGKIYQCAVGLRSVQNVGYPGLVGAL